MKPIAIILTCFTLSTTLAMAQEHGGHGRAPRPRGKQQQQQQQQRMKYKKRKVIKGQKAEALFRSHEAKGSGLHDLSSECSSPVFSIGSTFSDHSVCFDRGATFKHGQFKCYVKTAQAASFVGSTVFDLLHNRCGGDGIKVRRQH